MEGLFAEMEQKVPKADEPTKAAAPEQDAQELPKLSPPEFKIYNRMSEHMDMFHEHFRQTWNTLYNACKANKRPSGMSISAFLNTGKEFVHYLTFHHSIEETRVFPILAQRMPAFKKELQLLTQHQEIHKGLDKLEAYLKKCTTGETELRLEEMKGIMDTFGEVLWTHLDEEVHELRAENMRKYWSINEIKSMPM